MEKIGDYLLVVLDWSEVWAMIIPLSVLLFRRQQPSSLRPVTIYLWIGFLINIVIDIIVTINEHLPGYVLTNNPFYNLHSVVRLACFSFYFVKLQRNSFSKIKKGMVALSVTFILINFIFFENFFNYDSFSGNLLASEAYALLVFCMLYYLAELKDDNSNLFESPHFWVVTGLSLYVVVNFYVFLFYWPMLNVDIDLAINIWNVHNVAFIVFCLFLTKAFYGPFRYQYSI